MRLALLSPYLLLACLNSVSLSASTDGQCSDSTPERKIFWGDLHVHTTYSMDAYAFGTVATPVEAYAFAQGEPITLADGKTRQQLRRPLDFVAVADHAETFDVMNLCTLDRQVDTPYCRGLREGAGIDLAKSRSIFANYLLPVIAGKHPKQPSVCAQEGIDCDAARVDLWHQIQEQANAANTPCKFTAFIANEWSATPNNAHWHRNLIFASENVTSSAIDYVRYPSPLLMWQALEAGCKESDGCDVVAIPHNTNFAEGGGFDVESEDNNALRLRSRYERLVEVHQSKGNSECLAEDWDNADSDCGFEIAFPNLNAKQRATNDPNYLKEISRSYVRSILNRGLLSYVANEGRGQNPLQLGFVGSTDTHTGSAGATEEDAYTGDAWGGGGQDPRRIQQRPDYNPGGLVAIWAEENTRESLFSALKRRETYATSGTRIALRFSADHNYDRDPCAANYDYLSATPMGGTLHRQEDNAPRFTLLASKDTIPLSGMEIIKGTVDADGEIVQTVIPLAEFQQGSATACQSWVDPEFNPRQPAYWYARVKEQPTPRWSKRLCESLKNCDQNPGANRMIQETAWSSPIWYLP